MPTESTGIPELDFITGGLPRNSLTILIGLPGTGKTVMALQMATAHARQGHDAVVFSAFSEPHEKLVEHLSSLAFFDPDLIGDGITLLSLKSALAQSPEVAVEAIMREVRGKRAPLLVIDGFRGLYQRLGTTAVQDLLSGLSSQMPYHNARCVIASETLPEESGEFFELSTADVLIALSNARSEGAEPLRTIEVFKVRGHGYREGLHGLVIDQSGVTIFPRLATSLPSTTPPVTSRRFGFDLPAFDTMLGGGLPEFSSTVITGDYGTGKTTFGLHYLLAGAKLDEPGLLVSLTDTESDLLCKATDLGLDLPGAVEAERVHVIEAPIVELNPYLFAWRIKEAVEQWGIKRLVIDSLTELEDTPGVQRSPADYLSALGLYSRRAGVTSVMTQDTLTYGLEGPPTHLVHMPVGHNRVLLRRIAYRGSLYRVCSVVSMQRSEHDTGIREFRIGEGGIRILDREESEPGVLHAIEREQPAGAR